MVGNQAPAPCCFTHTLVNRVSRATALPLSCPTIVETSLHSSVFVDAHLHVVGGGHDPVTTPLEPEVEKEAVCRKGRKDDNLSFDANPHTKNFRKNVYVSESRLGRWLHKLD